MRVQDIKLDELDFSDYRWMNRQGNALRASNFQVATDVFTLFSATKTLQPLLRK